MLECDKYLHIFPVHIDSFMTTALNQSKVKITWDETDPGRLRTTMRKFDKKDLLDMDFKAYLASSSDDDDDGRSVDNQEQDSGDDDDDDDDKRIAKYKVLWFISC